jgi:hypothetical protein
MQPPRSRGVSQRALLELLGNAWESSRLWGAIYSHRQACLRYVRDELWQLLDDPGMTRRRMRREIEALIKRVEEKAARAGHDELIGQWR